MKFSGERFVPNLSERELMTEHLHRYYSVANFVKDKTVLDAASGEGYGTFILSEHALHVTGIDNSQEAIVHAKLTYNKSNISFIQGSVENLPFSDKSFDVVISFETIEHVDEVVQHLFLKEIKRVLRDDGVLIISTPNKEIYTEQANYKNPYHVREFYKDEFYVFLNNYFTEIDLYNQKFEISSVILNNRSDQVKRVHIEPNDHVTSGKYMIAICSNQPISHIDINSFIPDHQDELLKKTQRIISLQNEVEERNSHIKFLDGEILSKDQAINQLNEKTQFLQEQLTNQNSSISTALDVMDKNFDFMASIQKKLETSEEELKKSLLKIAEQEEQLNRLYAELESREEIFNHMNDLHIQLNDHINQTNISNVNEKDQIIQNQIGHINMLLEQERKLNNILNSGGWKALTKYYKFRDLLFPNNSKRRLVAKLTVRVMKNPKQLLAKINKENIRKFRYYLKTEDPSLLESRVENYLERHKESSNSLDFQLYQGLDTSSSLVFPVPVNPLVSIVIPVYNQWHFTYACLKSILDNTNGIAYEIIIADDMSSDKTTEAHHIVKNVKIVRDGTNRGFLLNCNNAAKYAQGKYLLFLNNDTNVQPEWLNPLIELIESNEEIGMVGSKLIYPDGRQQEAGGIIWKDASGWNYGRLDDPNKPEYNYVKEVDYISGAAIMIRSDLWNEIGGFDERYAPAYFEDSDLAFEVRKRGYKVVFQPKSVVVHFEGVSHGTDTSSGIKSYQLKNREKFIEKWQNVLASEHFENGENVFWARDRSRSKKTILVIDHYVPHYDKDAGSRTTFQYLKMFSEMGFNVKFLGDNFFKHEPYATVLEQMGIEVLYGTWYRDNYEKWIKANADKIDYVYLNRPHISIKYMDLIRKYSSAKIIYYGHDLHFIRELKRFEIEKNEEFLKSSNNWKKIEFELFEKSDVIFTLSESEYKIIRDAFPSKKILIIPTFIYEDFHICDYSIPKEDLLFVGGFSHTPNVDAVNWFVNDIFPLIQAKLPEVKCYIVGSNPPKEILDLNSRQVIIKGFISDAELISLYQQIKIVVIPLRYGAGVKGKTIEAMYHSVPIVSTDFGIEGLKDIEQIITPCNTAEDFANEVINLYNDETRLNQLREKYRDYVKKYFSKQRAIAVLKEALED